MLFGVAPRDNQLLDDFVAMLNDEDSRVEQHAINKIRYSGMLGRRALPLVIEKLRHSGAEVQLAAARMIGSHGRTAAAAVPAFIDLLKDPDPQLRGLSAQTLGQLEDAAQPAFSKLLPLLEDAHVEVRVAVANALGSLDLDPERVRPHFAKLLTDKESDVRRAALRNVRRFGRRGAIFVPDLISAAANPADRKTVQASLRRFRRSGPDPRSVPELIELLQHDEEAVRLLAVQFLGLTGEAAKEALPELAGLSEDPSEEVRKEVKTAIETISNLCLPITSSSCRYKELPRHSAALDSPDAYGTWFPPRDPVESTSRAQIAWREEPRRLVTQSPLFWATRTTGPLARRAPPGPRLSSLLSANISLLGASEVRLFSFL